MPVIKRSHNRGDEPTRQYNWTDTQSGTIPGKIRYSRVENRECKNALCLEWHVLKNTPEQLLRSSLDKQLPNFLS